MMQPRSAVAPEARRSLEATGPEDRLTSWLRPGVPFPDWSVVRSASAREALVATLEAAWDQGAWQGHTPAEDAVRRTILELYRELGHAPPREEIARRSGMARERVRALLDRLAGRDLVVLEGDQIVGAYPLTIGRRSIGCTSRVRGCMPCARSTRWVSAPCMGRTP